MLKLVALPPSRDLTPEQRRQIAREIIRPDVEQNPLTRDRLGGRKHVRIDFPLRSVEGIERHIELVLLEFASLQVELKQLRSAKMEQHKIIGSVRQSVNLLNRKLNPPRDG